MDQESESKRVRKEIERVSGRRERVRRIVSQTGARA